MDFLYFLAAYLLAFIPVMSAWFCLGTFLCACRLLYFFFGRPRASVACYENAAICVVFGAVTWYGIKGIFWLGALVGYHPGWAIFLMFVWPGSLHRKIIPYLWREAALHAEGKRFNWLREVALRDAEVKEAKEDLKNTLRNALPGGKD